MSSALSDAGEPANPSWLAPTRAVEPDFLRLTRAEAIQLADRLGLELRIIDSDDAVLTADLRSRRMTIDVRAGIVTSAIAG